MVLKAGRRTPDRVRRKRQNQELLLTLLVSRGVPMLLGSDFRRTQGRYNNAYCHTKTS